jgi:hypothetical protein
MSKPSLTVTLDFTKNFNDIIAQFKKDAVLVGIPQEDAAREGSASINNATLLAINNFGSPANNIPARPVMNIGIKNAQDAIAMQFRTCAKEVLSKGTAALETYYNRVGMIAANSIKKAINDQDFSGAPGPADATLRARKYLTKAGFKGTKSLVVTGQMRNAITYVVNKWGK